MNESLVHAVAPFVAFLGSSIIVVVAYYRWKRQRDFWRIEASNASVPVIYRKIWEKLEAIHKDLFLAELVTQGDFDKRIADMVTVIRGRSSYFEEEDAALVMQYLETLRRVFNETDQVFGLQRYYLSPHRCDLATEVHELRSRIRERFCKVIQAK
ncbi:MAG: hypothetical protein M1132_06000 [Chloroflexi bacterium]|nr:hypothetical protein [Chloroflexota bacterium]